MENYQNPDWWDDWLKKNYKKQMKLMYQRDRYLRSRAGYLPVFAALWNFLIQ
jgi:hypothetical protein